MIHANHPEASVRRIRAPKLPSPLWLTFAMLVLAAGAASGQQEESSGVTVIQGARIIDAASDEAIEDAVLVIEGRTIRAIGPRGSVDVPSGAATVDLTGKTIMPGIFNAHGHIGRRLGMSYQPENYSYETVQQDANAYLYFGVTHSTSLGQDWPPMGEFIRDQRAGRVGGARLYYAEFGFTVEGGFQSANPLTHKPRTPEEARRIVQRLAHELPVDIIKMWVGFSPPSLEPAIFEAIIDEARRQGLRSIVHAYNLEPAREFIRAGVDIWSHSAQDGEVDDEFVRLALENGIVQIPTLISVLGNAIYLEPGFLDHPGLRVMFPEVIDIINTPEYVAERTARYSDPPSDVLELIEQVVRNLQILHAAGVPMLVGTDSGGPGAFQGIWEHREMELLVRAGLTPMEAIRAATLNGARAMGVDLLFGSLEPGKVADFIVLGSNPLDDITNSLDIDAVWMDGREVDRAALAPQHAEASVQR